MSRSLFGSVRPAPEKVLAVNLILGMCVLLVAVIAAARQQTPDAIVLALFGTLLSLGAPLVLGRPAWLERTLRVQAVATLLLALFDCAEALRTAAERLAPGDHEGLRYLPGLHLVLLSWAAVQLDACKRIAFWVGLAVEVILLVLLLSAL